MKTHTYQAVLTKDAEGGYDVEFPDLPGCFTYGDTLQEAVEMAKDAATTYVAALMKDGLAVPKPTCHDTPAGNTTILIEINEDESWIAFDPMV